MRIAIVTAHAGIVGGAETYLAWLVPSLVAAGHQVAVAFERPALGSEGRVFQPSQVHEIDISQCGDDSLVAELRRFRPDVVFVQGSDRPEIDAAMVANFKSVLFAHAHYGTCATGTRVHQWPSRRLCTRELGTACLAVNYLAGCGALRPHRLLVDYRAQMRRKGLLADFRAVVVASEYMRQVVRRHARSTRLLVNPYPPSTSKPDAAPPTPRGFGNRVVFIGRVTKLKGPGHAVEAVARAKQLLGRELSLVMAGVGPELERCRQLAAARGVSLETPGWVDATGRQELLRSADALIVPSLWSEPFGMVGIEAGCVGTPAVAYRAFGITEWLRPHVSGELADGDGFEPEQLARALARVVGSPEAHHQLRLGAWNVAREYSPERHLDALLDLFEQVALAD